MSTTPTVEEVVTLFRQLSPENQSRVIQAVIGPEPGNSKPRNPKRRSSWLFLARDFLASISNPQNPEKHQNAVRRIDEEIAKTERLPPEEERPSESAKDELWLTLDEAAAAMSTKDGSLHMSKPQVSKLAKAGKLLTNGKPRSKDLRISDTSIALYHARKSRDYARSIADPQWRERRRILLGMAELQIAFFEPIVEEIRASLG